jgi:hypothetical protein
VAPSKPEPDDWTLAVEAFYCGEYTAADLERYARTHRLSEAEAWHLAQVAQTDHMLSRLSPERLARLGLPIERDDKGDVLCIALPSAALAARDHLRQLQLAAAPRAPLQQVKDLFDLESVPFTPSRTLSRYLRDDWVMFVVIDPGADVVRVTCGGVEMQPTEIAGLLCLQLDRTDPNEIVTTAIQELTVEFEDRTTAMAFFY